MDTIPTPTTSTCALSNGIIAQVTKWNLGEYTLYRFEEPNYTGWSVINADRTLPRIEDGGGFGQPSEFGVSCTTILDMTPTEAAAYAGKIMEAAEIASTFNEIIANNC